MHDLPEGVSQAVDWPMHLTQQSAHRLLVHIMDHVACKNADVAKDSSP